MTCERCFQDDSVGEHGHMKCAYEARRANAVIGDDIPGGLEIRHGLCHADGTPRKFYSKTEINAAAKAKGLENHVVHVPKRGSDKSDKTSRWV